MVALAAFICGPLPLGQLQWNSLVSNL